MPLLPTDNPSFLHLGILLVVLANNITILLTYRYLRERVRDIQHEVHNGFAPHQPPRQTDHYDDFKRRP
jgi:hypothetical protein